MKLWISKQLLPYSVIRLNGEIQKEIGEFEKLKYFYIQTLINGSFLIKSRSLHDLFIEISGGKKTMPLHQFQKFIIECSEIEFDNAAAHELISMVFPDMLRENTEISLFEFDKILHKKIKFETEFSQYLIVGLKIATSLCENARQKLTSGYEKYDADKDGKLKYFEFIQFMLAANLRINKTKWEIFAGFDEVKDKEDYVSFEEFLIHGLYNPQLKGFIA